MFSSQYLILQGKNHEYGLEHGALTHRQVHNCLAGLHSCGLINVF